MKITFCQVLPSEAHPEYLQHLRRSSLWQQLTLKAILETILVAQSSFFDGSRNLDPSLVKYYLIITTAVKLKVTLPNIVIRSVSGTFSISKTELFVAIVLH